MKLVDADALSKAFDEEGTDICADYGEICEWGFSCKTVHDLIANAPTVDAAPVVHGHWIITEYEYFDCSVCGDSYYTGANSHAQARSYLNSGYFYRYCPNCGAKMDGGGEK